MVKGGAGMGMGWGGKGRGGRTPRGRVVYVSCGLVDGGGIVRCGRDVGGGGEFSFHGE